MDINPKGFTSGKFEFADFIKEKDCQVILFPTNWIDHDRSRDKTSFTGKVDDIGKLEGNFVILLFPL